MDNEPHVVRCQTFARFMCIDITLHDAINVRAVLLSVHHLGRGLHHIIPKKHIEGAYTVLQILHVFVKDKWLTFSRVTRIHELRRYSNMPIFNALPRQSAQSGFF